MPVAEMFTAILRGTFHISVPLVKPKETLARRANMPLFYALCAKTLVIKLVSLLVYVMKLCCWLRAKWSGVSDATSGSQTRV
jgi:hypothetical protein